MPIVYLTKSGPYAETKNAPVMQELMELLSLKEGWRFGEGLAPLPEAIRAVWHTLNAARDVGIYDGSVTPLVDGGIGLDLYALPIHAEFFFSGNGSLSVVFYRDDDEVLKEKDGLAWDEGPQVAREFGEKIWSMSASCTQGNTSPDSAASIPAHSPTRAAGDSPYSILNAPFVLPSQYVSISLDTMSKLRASHPSTGGSTRPNSRLAGA